VHTFTPAARNFAGDAGISRFRRPKKLPISFLPVNRNVTARWEAAVHAAG
jgi:hypothetical protein